MYYYDELISIETARLACDKGFNIPVLNCYNENGEIGDIDELEFINYNRWPKTFGSNQNLYSAPTQSALQKWIRENKFLYIEVSRSHLDDYTKNSIFNCNIIDGNEGIKGKNIVVRSKNFNCNFDSYDEALEFGLQHALTLL